MIILAVDNFPFLIAFYFLLKNRSSQHSNELRRQVVLKEKCKGFNRSKNCGRSIYVIVLDFRFISSTETHKEKEQDMARLLPPCFNQSYL
jgi:hypothetical protein